MAKNNKNDQKSTATSKKSAVNFPAFAQNPPPDCIPILKIQKIGSKSAVNIK